MKLLILCGSLTYLESFSVNTSIFAHVEVFRHKHVHRHVEVLKC